MDEDIFIPLIVFSFILAMVWMILNYFKWKHQQKREAGETKGSSLRTSELQALMRDAVEEANAPLIARMDTLEEEVRQAQRLLPAKGTPLHESLKEVQEQPDPVQRRVT